MPSNTLFLRFDDQDQARAVLGAIGIRCAVDESGTMQLPCDGEVDGTRYTLDLLFATGTLHHPTGETVSFEGEPIALLEPIDGFHVNLRWDGPVPDALRAHLVSPASPSVGFLSAGTR